MRGAFGAPVSRPRRSPWTSSSRTSLPGRGLSPRPPYHCDVAAKDVRWSGRRPRNAACRAGRVSMPCRSRRRFPNIDERHDGLHAG